MTTVYYECGICEHLHPWNWNGDCREDANRFTLEQVEGNTQIRTWEERLATDAAAPA